MERFLGILVADGLVGFFKIQDETQQGALRLVAHLLVEFGRPFGRL